MRTASWTKNNFKYVIILSFIIKIIKIFALYSTVFYNFLIHNSSMLILFKTRRIQQMAYCRRRVRLSHLRALTRAVRLPVWKLTSLHPSGRVWASCVTADASEATRASTRRRCAPARQSSTSPFPTHSASFEPAGKRQ